MTDIRDHVRQSYAGRALQIVQAENSAACCAADTACACGPGYTPDDLRTLNLASNVSLGCGNPTALAELKPGERVLDLGSGAGLDVLLSARRVAPGGHAYGVDMTDEMLELARSNQAKAGVPNASFLKGTIESVPLDDDAVDVVISNCVINLARDKREPIREAFRVLRPGGRLAVADMVELRPLPEAVKQAADEWAGCVAGTIPIADYEAMLKEAGFTEVEFEVHDRQAVAGIEDALGSAYIRAVKPNRP